MQKSKSKSLNNSIQLILFVFSLLLLTQYSFSQGSLSVQIVDNENHPIEFSNLRLFKSADSTVVDGAYSDEKGFISIDKIPFGKYYAIIAFFDFDDYHLSELEFSSEKKDINLGKIFLTPLKSQEFEEVVVKGRETTIMESSIDKRVYNVDEDMTSIGGDANDILNNIPSVEVDNEGNISLRGNSSVKILINGRESALTSGDDPLAGIPANAIERIEIVTNPSAKYNPEGTAGIINVILKKTKLRGFNGNVQLTAATGNLYNGSVGFNYRNEKFNVFANYSFRYADGYRNHISKRKTDRDSISDFLDQNRNGTQIRKAHTANLGIDFFIKENHTLGFSLSGSYRDRIGWGNQENKYFQNDVLSYYWNRESHDPFNRQSADLNVNYKWDFADKKGDFMFTATSSLGSNKSSGEFNEYYFNADGSPFDNNYLFEQQKRKGNNNRTTVSADLVRAINEKMKYEAGLEARIHRVYDSFYSEYLDTSIQMIVPDSNVINELKHSEDIISAYGIFAHDVTKLFKYQIGARLEQAFINPQFLSSNQSFDYKYFTVYPSIHLAVGDEDMGTFFVSYSRRVNRPSPWQMNPFPIIDDPLNVRRGNPGLLPEFINSYELGYEKSWKRGSISTTAYFKQTENKIQRITQFQDDGVSLSTFANIDKSYDYGLEIIGTYNPFSWWRNMVSFNLYESQVSANYNGTNLSNKGFTWDAKLNITFSLFKNTTNIQIIGGYNAPRYTVQGRFQWTPGIDMGITRSFLNKNLVIGVRVSDIFDQKGFFITVNDQGREQQTEFKWLTRRVHFTLSYKFGNLKINEKPDKKGFPGGDGDMEMM